jgi:hypothetical protein
MRVAFYEAGVKGLAENMQIKESVVNSNLSFVIGHLSFVILIARILHTQMTNDK